ncbi:thioredoxin domain-containing protein [Vibrio sp. S11_S32]|nr:thioredoxin domain-containing protein [Vibrio sp. S11_S32]
MTTSITRLTPIFLALLSTSSYAATPTTFTPEQQAQIGNIASQYLIDHPEVLITVSQKLQEKQIQQQQSQQKQSVLSHQKELLRDKTTPFVGNKNAKVNVIEFFDYQCVYCAKIAATVHEMQIHHPNIKFIYKETPIFGSRWEPSKYAAQIGLEVFSQKGGKAYSNYHYGIFNTGLNEGKLTQSIINKKAKAAGINISEFTPTESYQKNLQLFSELGFKGTPAFVVMPSTGATIDNIFVINGADNAALNKAIATLQKK